MTRALEHSHRRVRLGLAPPSQTVRGSLTSVWDAVTRVRATARTEILGVEWCDPETIDTRATAAASELLAAVRAGAIPSYRESSSD